MFANSSLALSLSQNINICDWRHLAVYKAWYDPTHKSPSALNWGSSAAMVWFILFQSVRLGNFRTNIIEHLVCSALGSYHVKKTCLVSMQEQVSVSRKRMRIWMRNHHHQPINPLTVIVLYRRQKIIVYSVVILCCLVIVMAYECPHCWGTGHPCGLHIRRTGHNPPRGPSVVWWMLTTANAAGTNGLTCLPKHELEIINFWSPIQWLTNVA
jgi:hypothetical protein